LGARFERNAPFVRDRKDILFQFESDPGRRGRCPAADDAVVVSGLQQRARQGDAIALNRDSGIATELAQMGFHDDRIASFGSARAERRQVVARSFPQQGC
jgi:hypothetical protein